MKKSYNKMFIFQSIMFIILIVNSFVSNILKEYNIVFVLILLLVLFKIFFGFERDRHRYTKDVILDLFIFLIVFFILYYLFGIVIGFARIDNYYSFLGLKNFILPTILFIILKEFFRYMMLQKCENNKMLLFTTYLLFVLLDVTDAIYYNDFSSGYNGFIFLALSLLPAVTANFACSYVSLKTGYRPVIVYLLVTELYLYLIPIVPDPNEYLASIINLVLPLVWAYRVYLFFDKEKDKIVEREYKKKNIIGIIIPTIIIIALVYFTSGYFRYYAVAIASGSMSPAINKGDIVVIDKGENQYHKIKVGNTIAFKYNNVVIVHRVIDVLKEDGHYYFYTKGDANATPDNYAIEEEMIVGIVKVRIPFVGLPTVWLNE